MVRPLSPEKKSKEEIEKAQKKREEQREKDQREKKEQEEYLNRLRNMIQEDRKANMEIAKRKIGETVIMQTASLEEAPIKPLAAQSDIRRETADPAKITIKIIYETEKQLHTLDAEATVKDLGDILRKNFKIKRPKAFVSAAREIDFSQSALTLKSQGVADMDTIYAQSA